MRGKVGFVLGAALGYVLGTRAGRARYEQIKRGANAVWETPLVQQRVSAVKSSLEDGVDVAKSAAAHLMKSAFAAATQQSPGGKSTNGKSHSTSPGVPTARPTGTSASSPESTEESPA